MPLCAFWETEWLLDLEGQKLPSTWNLLCWKEIIYYYKCNWWGTLNFKQPPIQVVYRMVSSYTLNLENNNLWNLTKVIDIIDGLIPVDQSGWINIASGCIHMVFGENINMEESKLSA